MLTDFIEQAAKGIIYKIIPPVQRYFTYIFILIGIVWLTGANYYYFTDECDKSKGALITGMIFFALAILTTIMEYFKRTKAHNHQNEMSDMLIRFFPIILFIMGKLKNIILGRIFRKFIIVGGAISLLLYYMLGRKK